MSNSAASLEVRGPEFIYEFGQLHRAVDKNSFFRSPGNLRLITELTGSRLHFAVSIVDGVIQAALPFAIRDGRFGAVINSLPFYGTCSAVLWSPGHTSTEALVETVLAYGRSQGACSVTLVDDWRAKTLAGLKGAAFQTHRTNQFIELKRFVGGDPMAFYHQKTRNLVRKAEKLGVKVRRSEGGSDIAGLEAAHRENMAGVNGVAKPRAFFDRLRDASSPLGEHALFVASLNGRDCAYLLNFYCGDTVEYYMPAVYVEDRASNPLNLLIHTAICDAVRDGFAFWNFGGTWPTQESLRHFKVRWGSSEAEYSYFTYILDDSILANSAAEILSAYPYFFVAPFDKLGAHSGSKA